MDQQTIEQLLSPVVQQFIRDNELVDVKAFVLKQKAHLGLASSLLAEQISGRRKAKHKIPTYYEKTVLYPPGLNLEQSSSEDTALFKAKLFLQYLPSRKNLIDLSGGFGVDSYFLSKVFKAVHYIEPNKDVFEVAKKNHTLLLATNITHHHTTAENFLSEGQESSAIFVDPSRRKEGAKVFALSDCEPNVIELQQEIFRTSSFLLVKASPMLDIKHTLKELNFVKKVVALSVENEMKELLFICNTDYQEEPLIEAADLKDGKTENFAFKFSDEETAHANYTDPQSYLYEPNAAVLKAGAFKSIASSFGLSRIHVNTHLYTSEKIVHEFPGRIFKIDAEIKPDKKTIAFHFPEHKANVTTRNYPLSVDELKKKTNLKDGGEKYLIGFSGETKKFLVAATRLK